MPEVDIPKSNPAILMPAYFTFLEVEAVVVVVTVVVLDDDPVVLVAEVVVTLAVVVVVAKCSRHQNSAN